MAEVEIKAIEPLTQVDIDLLDHVAIWSGLVGTACFLVVLVVAIYISIKTTMPGRQFILASILSLAVFVGYEQYMGGNLEWVFGPVANLYKVIVYCSILLVFTIGYLKAGWYFIRGKNH
jgi:hypothetical protein